MKRHYLLSLLLLVSVLTMGQKTIAKFNETTHDFGSILEQKGPVTYKFEFANVGKTDLLLTNVQASCGCTTPKWSKKPVPAGTKGFIEVTYNPKDRPGPFNKTITVTTNSQDENKILLYIKGEVVPKPKK